LFEREGEFCVYRRGDSLAFAAGGKVGGNEFVVFGKPRKVDRKIAWDRTVAVVSREEM
jgi:hypothetical protein